jgi:type I restriction enzyme S subunit
MKAKPPVMLEEEERGHSCPPSDGEWPIRQFGEICDRVQAAASPSSDGTRLYLGLEHLGSGFPSLVGRGTEADVRSGKTTFQPNDVLFGKLRPYLRKSVRVRETGICSTDILVFRPKAETDPDFLCLLTHTDAFVDHAKATTSGVQHPRTSWASLREFKQACPPLPEQQKIAAVLGVVQRAMEQQERLLALTAELKKTLLHQLFTQGLPSSAKATEGRHHEPQKQTDIGPVPESWEVGKVGDAAKIQSGGTPSRDTPENWDGGTIPWVKTGEIDYCVIRDTEEKITPAGLASSAARLFPAGTLLMAMYGQGVTRGRVAILGIDATTNQACASITPHDEQEVSSRFLYHWFEYHYENLRKLGHGANQRNMNAALIRGFPLAYPPPSEQAQIVASLSALDAKRDHHQRKHATLTALFRTLLHQLMTAQIRVDQLVPLGAATGSE